MGLDSGFRVQGLAESGSARVSSRNEGSIQVIHKGSVKGSKRVPPM